MSNQRYKLFGHDLVWINPTRIGYRDELQWFPAEIKLLKVGSIGGTR